MLLPIVQCLFNLGLSRLAKPRLRGDFTSVFHSVQRVKLSSGRIIISSIQMLVLEGKVIANLSMRN